MIDRRLFLSGLVAVAGAAAITLSFRKPTPPVVRERLATARTYYVAPNGSDSNDGLSRTYPRRTMQSIIDSIEMNGHTVTIQAAPGTYQ